MMEMSRGDVVSDSLRFLSFRLLLGNRDGGEGDMDVILIEDLQIRCGKCIAFFHRDSEFHNR